MALRRPPWPLARAHGAVSAQFLFACDGSCFNLVTHHVVSSLVRVCVRAFRCTRTRTFFPRAARRVSNIEAHRCAARLSAFHSNRSSPRASFTEISPASLSTRHPPPTLTLCLARCRRDVKDGVRRPFFFNKVRSWPTLLSRLSHHVPLLLLVALSPAPPPLWLEHSHQRSFSLGVRCGPAPTGQRAAGAKKPRKKRAKK